MASKKEFPKGTIVLFISILILIGLFFFSKSLSQKAIPPELIAVLRPPAAPLKSFTLTDHNEQAFTKKNIKDKWSFLFFGYTHCPDVCPTTLHLLKKINTELKKNPQTASDMQVIFVSVDPERDKPAMLKKYTQYFNKEFISVTAPSDKLTPFAKQFAAAYIKEKSVAPGEYLISHTSSIFLIDPQMRIVASFSPPHYAATIISQYKKIHEMF